VWNIAERLEKKNGYWIKGKKYVGGEKAKLMEMYEKENKQVGTSTVPSAFIASSGEW
jgi:hypothetical protein